MGPKPKGPQTGELFRQPLAELINGRHPLVKLAELIDWSVFEREWAPLFPSGRGRPATPPRLVAGLLYLQHTFACSDEALIWTWVENPYWQHFCGETYFQHEPPIDPSSLSRWRKRIGEAGVEWLLTATIEAARKAQVIKAASLEKVIVDTTVMEKAIAYPTDSRLLERGRQHLVKLAGRLGIKLRQNYNRQAPRLAGQVGRYAHAKQYKRMRATLKKLRTLVGRVWRDIDRQRTGVAPEQAAKVESILARVRRLLDQKPKDKNKLYSLHAPEVECIAKGKARQPYEFGVKVTVATTHREGLVVGMRSLPGNPFDGHTLAEALEQVEILTEKKPKAVFVDKGYQGAQVPGREVWRSGMRRGVTCRLKRDIRRRSAIEPMIGHMKNEGLLRRNWLRGSLGDALHAVLCGAGHNLRMILRKLWLLRARILALLEALSVFPAASRNSPALTGIAA
ncbi:IS5 family transposase [Thauera sinica]|uniref:IS5 family transposase n=1 Tax=Thauera sinica TaxID=2665146 RepID=A0ABW1ALA4_9RHOO|nr:IS5 family transposase [Thauera sp. K11]ATE59098.1 IS5/IS1182 family transposase [Thauera sp. K11]